MPKGLKFIVSFAQYKQIKEWHGKHHHRLFSKNHELAYEFTSVGGIGHTLKGVCGCGKSINVTDVGDW